MKSVSFLLGVPVALGLIGCAATPTAPLEVTVLQLPERKPLANAEVRVIRKTIGIVLGATAWNARTSADGIARFPRIPVEKPIGIDVQRDRLLWRCMGSLMHPQVDACRDSELTALRVDGGFDAGDSLVLELRCVPPAGTKAEH